MSVMNEPYFWINGRTLNIDTLDLFTFVRAVPEPIPLEMIKWSSPSSALVSSSTQWSCLMAMELCHLMAQLYTHHELVSQSIVRERGKMVSNSEGIKIFEKRMLDLWEILDSVELFPISVWATSREDMDDAIQQFELGRSAIFVEVLNLPHIRSLIFSANQKLPTLKSTVRRLEADFNRYKKKMKKSDPH